jgi:rod shape determining protein RodA
MLILSKNQMSQKWLRWRLILSRTDFMQLLPLILLVTIGVLFIYSTGQQRGTTEAMAFWKKQIQWICIGSVFWLILTLTSYKTLGYWSWFFYLISIFLLIAVLVPSIGLRINGARRWLSLGGIRVQPSEFAKFAMLLLTSWILSLRDFNINQVKSMAIIAAITVVPIILISMEPDLGSSLVIIPMTAVLVFIAGLNKRFVIILLAVVIAFITVTETRNYFGWHGEMTFREHDTGIVRPATSLEKRMKLYFPILKDYQLDRILVFMDESRDRNGRGWHQSQAELAVGSGGPTGKGYMQSTQNTLGFLPETHTDFIFSVIAEETGFVGSISLLLIYLLLIFSALRTALFAKDKFGRYMATGIAAIIFTHSIVNIGMSIRLTPVTGLPLPLVSYGGSFMVSTMVYLGILQSIHAHRKKENND